MPSLSLPSETCNLVPSGGCRETDIHLNDPLRTSNIGKMANTADSRLERCDFFVILLYCEQ